MIRKIVVIDDDPVTLTMLTKLLAQEDVQVFSSPDGLKGWELIQRERPDLVISDLLVPHVDGLELSRRIKNHPALESTQIILMSAVYKGFYHRSDIQASGAGDFIAKPIDTKILREKINRLWNKEKAPGDS